MLCMFCGQPTGDDPVCDNEANVACRACGEAEIKSQIDEGFVSEWDGISRCSACGHIHSPNKGCIVTADDPPRHSPSTGVAVGE